MKLNFYLFFLFGLSWGFYGEGLHDRSLRLQRRKGTDTPQVGGYNQGSGGGNGAQNQQPINPPMPFVAGAPPPPAIGGPNPLPLPFVAGAPPPPAIGGPHPRPPGSPRAQSGSPVRSYSFGQGRRSPSPGRGGRGNAP